MKKIIFTALLLSMTVVGFVQAQTDGTVQAPVVNYEGQDPMDSDLDGLTDQGEIQIYGTDPKKEDSDGDGYLDGVEVISGSNPVDAVSNPTSIGSQTATQQFEAAETIQDETPWPWYVSRMSGLIAFVLLFISIFLGLTLRVPFLRKFFSPLYATNAHCWISLQATIFALIHGGVLTLDKFLDFSFSDVFIPFSSKFEPGLVALGIFSLYLMIILVATSYGKKFMSQKMWRAVHFSNIILYVIVVMHAYYLGTDMKNDIIRNIFIYSNLALVLLMLANMFLRIKEKIARKSADTLNNEQV